MTRSNASIGNGYARYSCHTKSSFRAQTRIKQVKFRSNLEFQGRAKERHRQPSSDADSKPHHAAHYFGADLTTFVQQQDETGLVLKALSFVAFLTADTALARTVCGLGSEPSQDAPRTATQRHYLLNTGPLQESCSGLWFWPVLTFLLRQGIVSWQRVDPRDLPLSICEK